MKENHSSWKCSKCCHFGPQTNWVYWTVRYENSLNCGIGLIFVEKCDHLDRLDYFKSPTKGSYLLLLAFAPEKEIKIHICLELHHSLVITVDMKNKVKAVNCRDVQKQNQGQNNRLLPREISMPAMAKGWHWYTLNPTAARPKPGGFSENRWAAAHQTQKWVVAGDGMVRIALCTKRKRATQWAKLQTPNYKGSCQSVSELKRFQNIQQMQLICMCFRTEKF